MAKGFKKDGKFHPIENKQQSAISSKDLDKSKLVGLKPSQIPKNAPASIKICSRCDKSFDINKAKQRNFFDLPICNACTAKGLKPL